jgi:hypothetical protein
MADAAELIFFWLEQVAEERRARAADPELARRVQALKAFQHGRFAHTYSDLLAAPEFGAAARFFLDELYGPVDFTRRDQQFKRVVPTLTRLFSGELVKTVSALAELHALSERLDTSMGRVLWRLPIDPRGYATAWREVGQPILRERQIALTVAVGRALERHTRSRLLRAALHAMRRPAGAAGLGDLQRFLEVGFDTFKDIDDPEWFLEEVGRRERKLASELFAMDFSAIEGVR